MSFTVSEWDSGSVYQGFIKSLDGFIKYSRRISLFNIAFRVQNFLYDPPSDTWRTGLTTKKTKGEIMAHCDTQLSLLKGFILKEAIDKEIDWRE